MKKISMMTVLLIVLAIAFFACEKDTVKSGKKYDSYGIQTVMSVATAADANPEIVRVIPGTDDKAVFIASATKQLFPITYNETSFTIDAPFTLSIDSDVEEMTSIDVSQPIGGVNYVAVCVAKTDCAKGSILFVNFNTGEIVKRVDGIGYNPDGCAFTKNSSHLIVACEDDREDRTCKPDDRHGGSVSIIDLTDGIANATLAQDYLVNYDIDSEPEHCETNANGDVIVSVQETSDILVFNVSDLPLEDADVTRVHQPNDAGENEAEPDGLYISPDGTLALISNERNGTFQMMDIASKTMIGSPHTIEADLPDGWQKDERKSTKRTEPEEACLVEKDGKLYAILALQEAHAVIVYDVTDPENPVYDSHAAAGVAWEEDNELGKSKIGSEGLTAHPTNGMAFSANEREGSITMYSSSWARDEE